MPRLIGSIAGNERESSVMNKLSRKARMIRFFAALIAAALLGVLPASMPAGAASGELAAIHVVRHGGADRYETSLRIAEAFAAGAGGTVDTVVMVSGTQWTDAAAAISVAGRFGAPLLMTPPEELRDDALAWLNDVEAERVIVVGTDPPGRDPAVSTAVTDALREAFAVERVSGDDQYLTAVAAARRAGEAGELSRFGRTAIIASGEVFADALVAGPLAAHFKLPVLLTPSGGLHPQVAGYLAGAQVRRVVLMGGASALSADVQIAVEALGIAVDRMDGATRFETATMFGEFSARHGSDCFEGGQFGIARARIPFDALSAAPLLAQWCAPLVLTDPAEIPASTREFIDSARRHRPSVTLSVFGGDRAVSQSALEEYQGDMIRRYETRAADSALPATDKHFIDHAQAAALFPECGPAPEYDPAALVSMIRDQARFAGFDRAVISGVIAGRHRDFATGWWTDVKLREHYGGTYPEIDVEWAQQRITISPWNQIGFGRPTSADGLIRFPAWVTVPTSESAFYGSLYEIMERDGYRDGELPLRWVHHYGMQTPRRVDPGDPSWTDGGGRLLWAWTTFMHQFPPVDREPAAWGMLTLLLARHPTCVAGQMLAVCDDPITANTSPHLRNDEHASPLGLALRNLVCGEREQKQATDAVAFD